MVIKRESSGAAIVTLPGSVWCSATMIYDASQGWRLLFASVGATPGADA